MATLSQPNPLAELAFLYMSRGTGYANQGNWHRALLWFERAASYAPEDPECAGLLAKSYEMVGRLPEAISAACEVVHLNFVAREFVGASAQSDAPAPADGQAPQQLALAIIGRSCSVLGDLPGAVRAWTALLNMEPECAEAWHGLQEAGSKLVRSEGAHSAWLAMIGCNARR
jgi:tetratricopeptide (TPR) repeat protein